MNKIMVSIYCFFSILYNVCSYGEISIKEEYVLTFNPLEKTLNHYGIEIPYEETKISFPVEYMKIVNLENGEECDFQIEDRNVNGIFDAGDILYFISDLKPGYSLFKILSSPEKRNVKELLFAKLEGEKIIISGNGFSVVFSGKSGLPEKYIMYDKEISFSSVIRVYGVTSGRIKGINFNEFKGEINQLSDCIVKVEKYPLRSRINFKKGEISGYFYVYPDGKIEGNINGDKNIITGVIVLNNIPLERIEETLLGMNSGSIFSKPARYICGGRFFFGGVKGKGETLGIGIAQPHKELDRPYPWIWIPHKDRGFVNNSTSIWLNHLPGDRFVIIPFTSKEEVNKKVEDLRVNVNVWVGEKLSTMWNEEKDFFKKGFDYLNKIGSNFTPPDLSSYFNFKNIISGYKEIDRLIEKYIEEGKKETTKLEKEGWETVGIKIALEYAKILSGIAKLDRSLGRIDRYHKRTLEGLKELTFAFERIKKQIPKQLFGKKAEYFHGMNIFTACYARPDGSDYGYCANIYEPLLEDDFWKAFDIADIEYVHLNFTWDRLEPEEGIYNFSELDKFMEILAKHNKKVYFQIGDNISIGMAPKWAVKKYPEWVYRDDKGNWRERDAFVWVSPELFGETPGWMTHLQKLVNKIVERYKPYEKNIAAWGIWNEPGFRNYGKDFLFQQELFLTCFRNFLKKRYNSIEELNRYWGTSYKSFDEIKKPEFIKAEIKDSLSLNGKWLFKIDPKDEGVSQKWYTDKVKKDNWRTIEVPGFWETQISEYKNYDGVAWYWKEINIPENLKRYFLVLKFGGVDDDCTVYINGEKVYENKGYNIPFEIPISNFIKDGKLQIAVRVVDTFQLGGIWRDVLIVPVGIAISYYAFPAQATDWNDFINEQLVGFLGFFNSGVRKISSLPVAEKTGQEIDRFCMLYSAADEFSKDSIYYDMAAFDFYNPVKEINWHADLSRCAHNNKKPIWIGEYGGYTEDHKGHLRIYAKDIPHTSWSAFLHGVKGFYHWLWTGYGGMSDHMGSPEDEFIEAAKLNVWGKVAGELFSAQPERKIAIFFPHLSTLLGDEDTIRLRWQSLYYMLNDMNVPIDFIDWKQIRDGKLSQYKLLIIPSSPFIRQEIVEKIKEYVKNGGKIIAYSDFGIWNEKGTISTPPYPGFNLYEIFGAILNINTSMLEEDTVIKNTEIPVKSRHIIVPIETTHANVFCETEKGLPLITKAKYGQGIAYLCSLDLGKLYENLLSNDSKKAKEFVEFIWKILDENNVSPEIKLWSPGIEAQVIKNDQALYLVINNRLSFSFNVNLMLKRNIIESEFIYDLISCEKHTLTKTGENYLLKTTVAAGNVRIFFLKKIKK
ncbi:MAG: beta-galactosidase [Candidatus Omnitrophica bacterium]|nr:beta-galactosidase [Candidatus Omnitrophota bacterium]